MAAGQGRFLVLDSGLVGHKATLVLFPPRLDFLFWSGCPYPLFIYCPRREKHDFGRKRIVFVRFPLVSVSFRDGLVYWEAEAIHYSMPASSGVMNIGMSDYFSRQSVVSEFGKEGLKRLQDANIAVVGTGGVGSAGAWFLASLGIGHLSLIDQDIVEGSNLHRLTGVEHRDLNLPKAEAVARSIKSRFPWTLATPFVETIRGENSSELLEGSDLILDGTDNFWTRRILNKIGIERKIPYLFTSAIANQGHLSLFESPATPCLECIIPGLESSSVESCETLGVTSSIVGLVGNLAAMETAKRILGLPTNILGKMLTIDLLGPDFMTTRLSKRERCAACGSRSPGEDHQGRVVMMCGEATANVLPEKNLSVNLPSLRATIPKEKLVASSESVLVYEKEGHRVSVFRTGRLLIDRVSNEKSAMEIAGAVWALIP
jgi:molybdopterin/thiamine biosynthesis adenylyltransferase